MDTTANPLPNKNTTLNADLEVQTTYTISNKQFVVTPVFCDSKKETLGKILLNLMKSDIDKL